jgi:hypothetical protein
MPVEIRRITAANLPDAARLCTSGSSLSDRPKGFTREVELESTRCKLSALRTRMTAGAIGLAAYRSGLLVGYAEVLPVDASVLPVRGRGFHTIQCLRVPEEAERDEVERDLCDAAAAAVATVPGGSAGLAVTAREKEWGGLGFEEVTREASEVDGEERVLWFRRLAPGDAPEFVPVERKLPKPEGKARVDLFTSDRCPWDKYVFDMVRTICVARRHEIALFETDCSKRREVLRYGVSAGVAVNGRYKPWVRPWRLPDEHTIRRALDAAV